MANVTLERNASIAAACAKHCPRNDKITGIILSSNLFPNIQGIGAEGLFMSPVRVYAPLTETAREEIAALSKGRENCTGPIAKPTGRMTGVFRKKPEFIYECGVPPEPTTTTAMPAE